MKRRRTSRFSIRSLYKKTFNFTLISCDLHVTHSEVNSNNQTDLTSSFDIVHETIHWSCAVI